MVVSYTNNIGYTNPYAQQPSMTVSDGGGNGGGGAFFKMFEDKENEEKNSSSNDVIDDIMNNQTNYYARNSVLKDYIDNSLLLNTEQVACTNITQHIALKSNVRETLQFLNLQAAKTMVNAKKRNYEFQSQPILKNNTLPKAQVTTNNTATTTKNFFEDKLKRPTRNFFMDSL